MQTRFHHGKRQLSDGNIFSQLNNKYVWNWHLLETLWKQEFYPFIIPVVCGFIDSCFVASIPLLLISKMSRLFVGTRYWRRGLNDAGDCVMDISTEMSLFHPNYIASIVTSRSSMPLKWRHTKIEPFQTPSIDTSFIEQSIELCKAHFKKLENEYQMGFILLDLLNKKSNQEEKLSLALEEVIEKHVSPTLCQYLKKDQNILRSKRTFHSFLDSELKGFICKQAYFLVDLIDNDMSLQPRLEQKLSFRYV
jgi:hypothetical protein